MQQQIVSIVIPRVPITVCPALKGYKGIQTDYEASLQHIKERFLEVAMKWDRNCAQRIKLVTLCSFDSKAVKDAFESLRR